MLAPKKFMYIFTDKWSVLAIASEKKNWSYNGIFGKIPLTYDVMFFIMSGSVNLKIKYEWP